MCANVTDDEEGIMARREAPNPNVTCQYNSMRRQAATPCGARHVEMFERSWRSTSRNALRDNTCIPICRWLLNPFGGSEPRGNNNNGSQRDYNS